MNKNTKKNSMEFTSLILRERFGNDIAREIKSYMCHDIRTIKYACSLIEKNHARYKILWYIAHLSIKKYHVHDNSYGIYWKFDIPYQMRIQSLTCKRCGDYILSDMTLGFLYQPPCRAKCMCIF